MARFKPTYSSVTATLALFVALSGGAYAAGAFPANSVGPKQIKKNAVERSKLKNNAVNGAKILDGSVSGDDVKESTLDKVPAATVADDSAHATTSAALDRVVYRAAAATAPIRGTNTATAGCDPGMHVVGGGVKVDDPVDGNIVDGYPDAGNTAWTGRAYANDVPVSFTVYAICTTATAIG